MNPICLLLRCLYVSQQSMHNNVKLRVFVTVYTFTRLLPYDNCGEKIINTLKLRTLGGGIINIILAYFFSKSKCFI